MAVQFDQDAAKGALNLLQRAHERWKATTNQLQGTKLATQAAIREARLEAYDHAVAVLTWSRGLDDMCQALPSYASARMFKVDLLGAARYACNRAVHQLLMLGQPNLGIGFPLGFPLQFNSLSFFKWAPEHLLPPANTERQNQLSIRAQYIQRFAGNPMTPDLADLRVWFEAHV